VYAAATTAGVPLSVWQPLMLGHCQQHQQRSPVTLLVEACCCCCCAASGGCACCCAVVGGCCNTTVAVPLPLPPPPPPACTAICCVSMATVDAITPQQQDAEAQGGRPAAAKTREVAPGGWFQAWQCQWQCGVGARSEAACGTQN
jgi:hypothetical protein